MQNVAPDVAAGDAPFTPDEPQGKSPPEASLKEMIETAWDEALRIDAAQEVLVRLGMRPAPDPQQLRRCEIFQALVRFLEQVDQHRAAVKAALRGRPER